MRRFLEPFRNDLFSVPEPTHVYKGTAKRNRKIIGIRKKRKKKIKRDGGGGAAIQQKHVEAKKA